MAGKLAELYVIIGANADKFMRTMDGVELKSKALVTKFRSLEKVAAAMGAALIGATAALVYKTAHAEHEIGHLAQRLGIGVEVLSSLKLAAQSSGIALEDMGMGLGMLARHMTTGSKIFKEMGIEVRKTNGEFKSIDEMLFEISDIFAKTSDETKKVGWSLELMGTSGKAMKPFLEMGPQALREWIKEAQRLGIVITERDVKAAQEFMDNLNRLKAGITGITRIFAHELIPIFSKFFAVAVEKLVKAKQDLDLAKWAKNMALGVLNAFSAITNIIYGLAMAFKGLQAVVFWVANKITAGIGWIITQYSKFLGLIGKIPGLGIYKQVAKDWESWGNIIIEISREEQAEFESLINKIADISESYQNAKKTIQDFKIALEEGDKNTQKARKTFENFLPVMKDLGRAFSLTTGEFEDNYYKLEMLNADYLDMVKRYGKEEIKYRKEKLNEWYEKEKVRLSDSLGRTEEYYKKRAELDEAYQSQLKEILKDEKNAWIENFEKIADVTANLFSQIGALADTFAQNRIADLDEEYQRKKETVDKSLMTDEQKYATTERLDREYERKKRAIQKQAFEMQKKISLATAAINIAEAITKALTAAPPPYNIILAAISAAAGAFQIAAIAAQKFPGAQRGAIVEREGLVHVHRNEIISPIEKLPMIIQQIPNLQGGGMPRQNKVYLTLPISVGGREIKREVVEIIQEESFGGRLKISARAIA